MELTDLLKLVSASDQVKLKVLHNAVIHTTKSYQDDPVRSRLKDWEVAQSALEDAMNELTAGLESNDTRSAVLDWQDYIDTQNKAEVFRHLQDMGYNITQRTFYRHCTQGKLHKSTGNIFTKRLVQQYVKTVGLYRPGTAPGEGSNTDDLARDKLKAEIMKLEESGARERLKRQKEEGKLIDREDLYLELAARAVTMDTGFQQMVKVESPTLIAAVKGDPTRQNELEDLLLDAWNRLLDNYATSDEFEVLFEDEEQYNEVQ